MKTISLAQALDLISAAVAVFVNGHSSYVCFPETDGGEDQPHLMLSVSPDDNEGSVPASSHARRFMMTDNETVDVEGPAMYLVDEDGNTQRITLLFSRDLETTPAPALEHLVKASQAALANPGLESGQSYNVIRITDQDLFALRLALKEAEAELARRVSV